MGQGKLRKFAENKTFACLLQPDMKEVFGKDHPIKGHWNEKMFAKKQPIVLELGCGRGEYTIDLAKRNPNFNYVGVDIKGARLWKGAKYAHQHELGNVAFLRTRIEFIDSLFAENEIAEIWLTFSDPQVKKPKKRLSSPIFLERYRKFLQPGGIVHLKTDSVLLHEYTKAMVEANSLKMLACTNDLYGEGKRSLYGGEFESKIGKFAVDALFEVQTKFESIFLEQGCKITYLSFVLDHEGSFIAPDFNEDEYREIELQRFGVTDNSDIDLSHID